MPVSAAGDAGGVVQNHFLFRKTQNQFADPQRHGAAARAAGVPPARPGPRRKEAAVRATRHRDKEVAACIEAWEALQPPGRGKGVTQGELPSLLLHLTGKRDEHDLQRVVCAARELRIEGGRDDPEQNQGTGAEGGEMLRCIAPGGAADVVEFTDARSGNQLRFTRADSGDGILLSVNGVKGKDRLKSLEYDGEGRVVFGGRLCLLPSARLPELLGALRALAMRTNTPHNLPSEVPAPSRAGPLISRSDLPRLLGEVYQAYHPGSVVLPETERAVDAVLDRVIDARLTRGEVATVMAQLNEGIRPEDDEVDRVLRAARPAAGHDRAGAPPALLCVVPGQKAADELRDSSGDYILQPSDKGAGGPVWKMRRRRYAYFAGSSVECAAPPRLHKVTRSAFDQLRVRHDPLPHPSGASFVVTAECSTGAALQQRDRVLSICGHQLTTPADLFSALADADRRGVWEMDIDVISGSGAGPRLQWALKGEALAALPARAPPDGFSQPEARHSQALSLRARTGVDGAVVFAVLCGSKGERGVLCGADGALHLGSPGEGAAFFCRSDRFLPGFAAYEACAAPGQYIAAPGEATGGPLRLRELPPQPVPAAFRAAASFRVGPEAWLATEDAGDLQRPLQRCGLPLPCAPFDMEEASFSPWSAEAEGQDGGAVPVPAVVNGEAVWADHHALGISDSGGAWQLGAALDGAAPVAVTQPHHGRLPHEMPMWLVPGRGSRAALRVCLPDPRMAEALYEKQRLRPTLQQWYVEHAGEDTSSAHCMLDDGDCAVL